MAEAGATSLAHPSSRDPWDRCHPGAAGIALPPRLLWFSG